MPEKKFSFLKKEWDLIKENFSEEKLRFFINLLIWPQCVWAEQELRERKEKEKKGRSLICIPKSKLNWMRF